MAEEEAEASQQEQHRRAPTGERPVESANLREQLNFLEDERPPRFVGNQPISSAATGYFSGGNDNSTRNWDGRPRNDPVIINNPSVGLGSGYISNQQMSPFVVLPPLFYREFRREYESFLAQNQISISHYQQLVPNVLNIFSTASVPRTGLIATESNAQEGSSGYMRYSQQSRQFVQFGSLTREVLSAMQIRGSFPRGELSAMQIRSSSRAELSQNSAYGPGPSNFQGQQQRAAHGEGLVPSSPNMYYSGDGSYRSTNTGRASTSLLGANDRNRITLDRGETQDGVRSSGVFSTDSPKFSSYDSQGSRASKPKDQNTFGQDVSSSSKKNNTSNSVVHSESYNQPDFATDYERAMFFVMKSPSEDRVRSSINQSIWASSVHGNNTLDAAYQKAKKMDTNCPIFLLFSVRRTKQFCGVAEMIGPVDFQTRPSWDHRSRGLFPVKWHIIKDVPNRKFLHILIDGDEKKPVVQSQEAQEVNLELGIQMLKVFQSYVADTSILQDSDFNGEKGRASKEKEVCRWVPVTRSEKSEGVAATEGDGKSRTG